jgi:hypothetical protein
MCQQIKKHKNILKLSQTALKMGKKCFSLSFPDKKMEDSIKECLHIHKDSETPDFSIKLEYQDNNMIMAQNWQSLIFKGENLFYNVTSKNEIQVVFPEHGIYPDAMRVLAFLYDAFYRTRQMNGRRDNDFLMHAAGISKDGRGFIFAGESGAGKTTVSKLSLPEATIISDESIIISEDNGNYWVSQGPVRTELALANDIMVNPCAVFLLIQDKINSVRRLRGYALVKKLVDAIIYVDLSAGVRRIDYFSEKLKFVSAMCNQVPVYELKFTKDKGFWKEIERVVY